MKEFIDELNRRLEDCKATVDISLNQCNLVRFIEYSAIKNIINELVVEYKEDK